MCQGRANVYTQWGNSEDSNGRVSLRQRAKATGFFFRCIFVEGLDEGKSFQISVYFSEFT